MGEESKQGITRRDLLRRGAALGGAVLWTTPVVQTLGMGRAFAQVPSPTGGSDISYIGINVDCFGDPPPFFVKWEDNGNGGEWEDFPGAAPQCEDKSNLFPGVNSSGNGFLIAPGPTAACQELTIPGTYEGCDITVWVKAASTCNVYTNATLNIPGVTTICSLI